MNLSPKAVVFDLDGTLVDSLPCVLKALNFAISPYSEKTIGKEIFPMLGGPPERFFPQLVPKPDDVPAALARLKDYFAEHGYTVEPFDGALPLLGELYRAGVPLAVWTGRDRASTEELFRQHDMGFFFEVCVCGDDLPTHKPAPEGMARILDCLALPASEVVFVGDSDVDVYAGRSSGVRTLLIRQGRELPEETRRLLWKEADDHATAYALVKSWFGLLAA